METSDRARPMSLNRQAQTMTIASILETPPVANQPAHQRSIQVHVISLPMLSWAFQKWIESTAPVLSFGGSSSSIAACIIATKDLDLDVILVDLDGDDPQEALSQLTQHTKAKVLALTSAQDDATKDKAIIAGVKGVLNKRESISMLVKAIECVHRGELWIDRHTTSRIFLEVTRAKTKPVISKDEKKILTLTKREREIIEVILRSPSVKAAGIAEEILISQNTLRNHMVNIYAKLEVANRTELYAFAIKHKPEFS